MTRREWLVAAEVQLASAGVDAARLEAQVLLAHHLGVTRASLLANLDEPGQADDLLAQRLNGEPLAYITGVREFYGRMFRVGPGALIPRQETETLINEALKLNWRTALDVGTGSGCLALTLAAERPGAEVHGLDVSEEALAWAKRNDAELNPDGERVTWHHADAFRWHPTEPFDLIVSN
ncbi:MAG: N5-glutamine methyltransferase family protein, partial [Armatimonadota bacterium]